MQPELKKKLKVLIVGPTPPPYYGVSNATQIILNSSMRETFILSHLDTSDRREGMNFGKIDLGNIYLALKYIVQLVWLSITARPDVVYIPISQAFPAYLRDALFVAIAKLSGARIVLHLRGAYFKQFHRNSSLPGKWLIRWSLGMADVMIVLGQTLKSIFDGLVPPERIRVVPNGVNPQSFLPHIGGNGTVRVCFISNLIKSKGYVELLKAIRILAEGRKLECVIAGNWKSDEDKEEAESFIRVNSLGGVIHFVGVVKGEGKKQLLASSDIFAFPTYYPYEGHPWAVIEAMAAGLPVVTTNQGCINETVLDGETGFIVPKRNVPCLARGIEQLCNNADLRASMGNKGRERIATVFSEARFIDQLASVFHEFSRGG